MENKTSTNHEKGNDANIKMEKSIYPKTEIRDVVVIDGENKYNSFTVLTTLRKEHEGKWYMWEFFKNWRLPFDNEKAKIQALEQFHSEVYFTIVCGKISESLTDMYGQPIFKEDVRQISEIDRIKELLRF